MKCWGGSVVSSWHPQLELSYAHTSSSDFRIFSTIMNNIKLLINLRTIKRYIVIITNKINLRTVDNNRINNSVRCRTQTKNLYEIFVMSKWMFLNRFGSFINLKKRSNTELLFSDESICPKDFCP